MKFSVSMLVNYYAEVEADSLDEAIDIALLSVPTGVEYNGDGIYVKGIDNALFYEE